MRSACESVCFEYRCAKATNKEDGLRKNVGHSFLDYLWLTLFGFGTKKQAGYKKLTTLL